MNAETAPVVIILVEPRTPGNVGMVARAMANFGYDELRLVNPCNHLADEARRLAVDAAGLLEKARLFPDLQSALADCQRAVAATRRIGKRRGRSLDVAEVADETLQRDPVERLALVFGREDSGLSSPEVALCSHTAAIATPGSLGSLNLAQAVLIFLYELSRSGARSGTAGEVPAQAELEPLFQQLAGVLDRIAFLNRHRPEHVLMPLRRILTRGIETRHDLALLRALWGRLEESIHDWRGRRRGDETGGKTN
ncbi:RNA methyltransferase [Desulfuromonas carbonis]|uniref:RNA methyltransferase n=1 Tax=Desulfuromonas sp. DDH964 TaxID=1823759 RepID=UPI00078BF8FB|nr:TrmH family RNA methyltransferase [Desulfuromonas sp. DDH964]AMV70828.1 tRNA (2'O-methyl-C32/U32)-methyltransferase [Desulfuromonas sp. DDH964]